MTLTIELLPALEERLQERARRHGQSVAQYAAGVAQYAAGVLERDTEQATPKVEARSVPRLFGKYAGGDWTVDDFPHTAPLLHRKISSTAITCAPTAWRCNWRRPSHEGDGPLGRLRGRWVLAPAGQNEAPPAARPPSRPVGPPLQPLLF